MKRVLLALSGGVDSSVAAYLLKKQGYDVVSVFMKNYENAELNECSWEKDSRDAMMVAEKLNIPFSVVNLTKPYEKKIVRYIFDEYQKGRTPNPDILCNQYIKFDDFMNIAKEWGFEYISTGHYCRKQKLILKGKIFYNILAGIDRDKDQSYFLCRLSQEQIEKSLFPIGDMKKTEVRQIARDIGLINSEKKDSQGICFIGKVKLENFLKTKIQSKQGKTILIAKNFDYENSKTIEALSSKTKYKPSDGLQIGEHKGAFSFTIGQRKGIGIGGVKLPLYVLDIDVEKNIIYVGEGKNHNGLYRRGLFVSRENIHWVNDNYKVGVGEQRKLLARIRYRQSLEKVTIYAKDKGIYTIFDKKQFAISSGQFVAWYLGDVLLGSGLID